MQSNNVRAVGEAGCIVKITVSGDARLADSLSDYLIGVFAAVVEFKVDEEGEWRLVNGFMELKECSDGSCRSLHEQVSAYCSEIAGIFGVAVPSVTLEVVEDQDWSTRWKAHFKPFEIIPHLVVAPSWEPYEGDAGTQVIVIDPGMAFGTGHHATTRLCLMLLNRALQERSGCRVLDVGTGTAILALAAACFGASFVLALDNDEEAVRIAGQNIAINKMDNRIRAAGMPLARLDERFQVVVANIVHDVLYDLASDLARVTDAGGMLILSGLLHGDQGRSVTGCFAARGFSLIGEEVEEQWCALQLRKDGRIGELPGNVQG